MEREKPEDRAFLWQGAFGYPITETGSPRHSPVSLWHLIERGIGILGQHAKFLVGSPFRGKAPEGRRGAIAIPTTQCTVMRALRAAPPWRCARSRGLLRSSRNRRVVAGQRARI